VDHDTVAAFREVWTVGRILGIRIVAGVEFDLYDDGVGIDNFHLIGYFTVRQDQDIEKSARAIETVFGKYSLLGKLDDYFQRSRDKVDGYIALFNEQNKDKGLELVAEDVMGYLTSFPNRYQLGMALFSKYGPQTLGEQNFRSATNRYFSKGAVRIEGKDGFDAMEVTVES